MKKAIVSTLLILASVVVKSQTWDDSFKVYTTKFKKVSPLDYKHHRFKYNSESDRIAIRSLGIKKVTSPAYKNHFDDHHGINDNQLSTE